MICATRRRTSFSLTLEITHLYLVNCVPVPNKAERFRSLSMLRDYRPGSPSRLRTFRVAVLDLFVAEP